jgi:hypothetical protein
MALSNATMPYMLALAGEGCQRLAIEEDRYLREGLNVHSRAGYHAPGGGRGAWPTTTLPAMQALGGDGS